MAETKIVSLRRKEREVARLVWLGATPKELAACLEIALPTARHAIRSLCLRVGATHLAQLVIWVEQNENCLRPGTAAPFGLHRYPCGCSCYCRRMSDERAA